MIRLWSNVGGLVMLAIATGAFAQDAPPASKPKGHPPAPTTPAGEGSITTADQLLAKLETADADVKSLDADVLYNRVFGLEGDEQERRGKLYYVDTKAQGPQGKPTAGSRKFAIHFKTLKMGGQPAMPQDQMLIF